MEQLKTRFKSMLILILALMLTLEGTLVPVHADGETEEAEYLIVLQNIIVAGNDLDGVQTESESFKYDTRFLAAYKSTNGKITEMINGDQITNSNVRSLQGDGITAVDALSSIQSENGATVYVLAKSSSGMVLNITDQNGKYVSSGDTGNKEVDINETVSGGGSDITHYFYKYEEVKSISDAFITVNPYKYDTGRIYDFDKEEWVDIDPDQEKRISIMDGQPGGNDTRVVADASINVGFDLKMEFMDRKISLPPVIYLRPGESQTIKADLDPAPDWHDPDQPDKTFNWYRCYNGKAYAKGSWYDHGVPSYYEKNCPVVIDDNGKITAKDTANSGDKCFVVATYKKNENIEAYCEVKIADASVTYYADPAGTEVLDSQIAENGDLLEKYPPATSPQVKENYTFAGWSTEPNMTAYADKDDNVYEYVADPDTEIEGHLNLYPIYIHDRLNVKLVPGDGYEMPTGSDGLPQALDFTVDLDEKLRMEAMNAATREGFTLDGWYTQSGVKWNESWGVTPEYCDRDSDGKPIIKTNTARKFNYYTVTLTAKWTAEIVDITVNYKKENGDPISTATVKTEDPLTLPEAPTPEPNMRFKGWKDSKGEFHSAGETLDYNTWKDFVDNGVMSFVATYEEIPTYSVSFDSDGGSYVPTQDVQEGRKATKPDPDPTKLGYKFSKWTLNGADFDFGTEITEPITLKALWNKGQFTVTFNTNGGTPIDPITDYFGEIINWPQGPERTHYEFKGWDKTYTTIPGENVTVNALWEPLKYKLTLDLNGGTIGSSTGDVVIEDIYGAEIKAENPLKEGYDFAGWAKEGTGDLVSLPKYMPDTNDTYVAHWIEKPVKVVPELDGDLTTTSITEGDKLGKSSITGTMKYNGETVKGTFWWVDPDTEPALSDSNKTEYDVLFIPDDDDAYENVPLKAKVEVKPAPVPTPDEDEEKAKAVKDLIDNLPDLEKLDKDDKEAVKAARKAIEDARKAYDELDDKQKKLIDDDTLKKLTDAEEAIKKIDPDDPTPGPGPEPEPEPQPEPKPIEEITYDDLTDDEKVDADKLAKVYKTDKDTAAKMLKTGKQYGATMDTMLLTTKKLTNLPNDNHKGTTFFKLRARAVKRTKTTMVLQWRKQTGADGYLIYTNKCGRKYKMKLKKTVKNPNTLKWNRKKLKKGTYYKYLVVAYKKVNGKKLPIAASCTVHCTTKSKSNTIAKAVKVNKTKVTLAAGKTFNIKAKEIKAEKGKTIQVHRVISYESSKPGVAKVGKKTGKVTAVSAGTAYIYAYAQDGVYKKIAVTVK